jgi:integrase
MPEFRNLVRAALFTGCRYGELTRLQVKDLDAKGGTVYVSESKSGKPRHVFLTEESVQWFTSLVAGKSPNAFILTREGVKRTKRKDFDTQWTDHDQKYYMALACEAARLEPIGFHELRHTYASALVNAGVPLAYVAAQLGHVDTKMVEKYYGHLCPSAMADAIRAAAPKFGLAASRVNPLKTKKA